MQTEELSLCPTCSHPVPYGNRFCSQCGTQLPQVKTCTQCGHAMQPGNRFCGQCGAPAAPAQAQSDAGTLREQPAAYRTTSQPQPDGKLYPESGRDPKPGKWQPATSLRPPAGATQSNGRLRNGQANDVFDQLRALMPAGLVRKLDKATEHISGEQREVTVLFLDVTNFTAASHRLDSEDIYLIIDEAMRLLVEIIYKYEGTVDKFTGDGLIALFGAPIAHENDPERALRASLEMLQALQPLRRRTMAQHNFDFQVRIGVNTGLVIAGSLGSNLHMEYTVIGDTVNMASRLESAAQPGSVLVSFSTYQRTRPLFNFVTLPPLTMKGFPDPVRAYRPIQVREQPGSVRGLPGMRVQMIGRTQDIAKLGEAIETVQQTGRRQITLITGDAGLGKSRLVVEFCESLRSKNIHFYQGNCLAYARSRPMWVVAEMIRNVANISEIDPVEEQVAGLRSLISDRGLDEDELLPVLMHILELASLESSAEQSISGAAPETLQAHINRVLHKLLLALHDSAYVLVFDDLHWVDPISREFLVNLIDLSEDVPVHLILVSRDFERQTTIGPLIDACAAQCAAFTDIRLRALSLEESRLLVSQLVRHTSAEIQELNELIVARAEGNPFYTEEIVRMLMDKGGIVEQGEEWVATSRAQELLHSVPGTLRGLILARFDQLSPELRYTLQLASVVGRSCPAHLLAKLHDDDLPSLHARLAELTERQFLQKDATIADRVYTFRHTLIQEAVYSTLLKRERRRIHGLVAEVLKQTNYWLPEEQAEALAYHYAESSDPEKALTCMNGIADTTDSCREYEMKGNGRSRPRQFPVT